LPVAFFFIIFSHGNPQIGFQRRSNWNGIIATIEIALAP